MDGESGKSTEEDDVKGVGRGESGIDWDEADGAGSRDNVKCTESDDHVTMLVAERV